MNLTLLFSRNHRWPEHYFSAWCLGYSQKLLTTKQCLLNTISFTIIDISFFHLRFDLFLIITTSQLNQKQCNVLWFALFPCFAMHSLRAVAMPFNIFSWIKRNRSFTAHIYRLCFFLWIWFNNYPAENLTKINTRLQNHAQ